MQTQLPYPDVRSTERVHRDPRASISGFRYVTAVCFQECGGRFVSKQFPSCLTMKIAIAASLLASAAAFAPAQKVSIYIRYCDDAVGLFSDFESLALMLFPTRFVGQT